jgi:hypothetical protein
MDIRSIDDLRRLYDLPGERAVKKQIPTLDAHCRRFIALSPFVVIATGDEQFNVDASPRGGDPGFVKIDAAGRLLLPDAPGNNRLDSLQNIVRSGRVGLLFLIPGFDETLRVNGEATLTTDDEAVRACTTERRAPKLVIRVTVQAAYLHCAKAFMRSKLWQPAAQVDRAALPTICQMILYQ